MLTNAVTECTLIYGQIQLKPCYENKYNAKQETDLTQAIKSVANTTTILMLCPDNHKRGNKNIVRAPCWASLNRVGRAQETATFCQNPLWAVTAFCLACSLCSGFQLFHVAYVLIKFANSPRPDLWVLERSVDNGRTFTPWHYFASKFNCFCVWHF